MTPTEIKIALNQLGGGANKRLGQHFLIDKKPLEVIVEAADIHDGDRVLEIGPGLGVLTRALLDRGANVIVIEQDRRMVDYLSGVGGRHAFHLQIIHTDATHFDWMPLVKDDPWKLIANLPYGITSLALRKSLYTPHPPMNIVVLIQREVGERILSVAGSSKKGKTSLLSLMTALACSSVKILRKVPPGAFFPPPKVDSVILQLIPLSLSEREAKWGIDPEKIMQLAKRGFAHPRKQLASNLRTGGLETHPYKEILATIGLAATARAEDLSPEKWAQLRRFLSTHESLDSEVEFI